MVTIKHGSLEIGISKPSVPHEGYIAPITKDNKSGGINESIQSRLGEGYMEPDFYVPCKLRDGAGQVIKKDFLFGAYKPEGDVAPISKHAGGIDEQYYPELQQLDKDSAVAAQDEVCAVIGIVVIVLWVISLLI